jgi:hypothetical protein
MSHSNILAVFLPPFIPPHLPTLYREATKVPEISWQNGKFIIADIRSGPVYGELPVIQ